jgi:hypothetical protein
MIDPDKPAEPAQPAQPATVTVQLGEAGEHPLSVLLFSWMRSDFFKRAVLAVLAAICAVMIGLEFVLPGRAVVMPVEGWPAFYGVIGFVSLSIAVLAGWPLGRALRRPENYYGEEAETETKEEAS